jgi:hypothetical protein
MVHKLENIGALHAKQKNENCRRRNMMSIKYHFTVHILVEVAQRKQKEPFRLMGKLGVHSIIQVGTICKVQEEKQNAFIQNMFLDYCSANCSMQLHLCLVIIFSKKLS